MTALSHLLLPAELLVACLNAATASIVACAIAVILSRRSRWALPVRHALLAAALGASLLAPVAAWLVPLPSVWTITLPGALEERPASVAVQSPPVAAGVASGGDSSQAPVGMSHPAAAAADRSVIAEPAARAPRSVVPDPLRLASTRGRSLRTTLPWARGIGTLLCSLWLAGVAVGLLRAVLGAVKLCRWLRTAVVADSPLLAVAARRAAECVSCHRKVAVYHSRLAPAPVSVGLFRPRIVVPTGIESTLAADQLQAVIQHEMAHIARRDLWIGLLQLVARIIYWWNPLVRLASRQLASFREQICDDIARGGLADSRAYAEVLIDLAERCSARAPVPATLGIGSSPSCQLEHRIRRILSSTGPASVRLSRSAAAGVSAGAALVIATILFAQVQTPTSAAQRPDDPPSVAGAEPAVESSSKVPADPTLQDLIQRMAAFERMYLPYEIKAMETFRFPDDLSPQERARNLRADGRKHQLLMEYAELERRVWRSKETALVDDEVEQEPYERFCDGERIVQKSKEFGGTQYYINNRKNEFFNYQCARPIYGVFCLSAYGASELFSEVFKSREEEVDLAWDNGDAKLTFVYGHPKMKQRFVLWLSRAHDWHPIRLQRYWDVQDKLFYDEWRATRFVRRGKTWRIAEGTQAYRDYSERALPDSKIKYFVDFQVLEEEYGGAVGEEQFRIEIPPGAAVRVQGEGEAGPPPPVRTRNITVTVVDIADRPIPKATVRFPITRIRDFDVVTTDEQGVARTSKAPAEDVVNVQITAAGFRPVTWIMGDVSQLRAIMAPLSPGRAVDEQGRPAADAWITNRPIHLRADGIAYVPQRDWDGRDDDWSGADGRFELKAKLTLSRGDASVPFIAVNQDRDRMAIRFVPARALGRQHQLLLQPLCHVRGRCLLEEMTELVQVDAGLETPDGAGIGSLTTRRALTPDGLQVDFEMRLPPGAYVLRSRQTSHHAGFAIPFSIPAGQSALDLGSTAVSPAGAVSLKGKPAPELDVQWPREARQTWEDLRGKVVVLHFWGAWCGPCVSDMPALMEIGERFRDEPMEWLSIHTPNLKDFDELGREIEKCKVRDWSNREFPFTSLIDRPLADQEYAGVTSRRYGVAEWSTLLVVDQQGNVVGPVSKQKLAATIARLLDDTASEE